MAGNIIQKSIISRADRLLASVTEAESITHPSECGALYEAYIRRFLEEIAPRTCELRSGFATDANGTEVSPQIDLMGIDGTALPPVELDSRSVICPIESLRFFIEIKATVKGTALDAIQTRVDSLERMELHFINTNRHQTVSWKPLIKCPAFLIGYKSNVSRETLVKWINTIPELFCIVVVGQYAMWKATPDDDVEFISRESGKNELLFLASKIHDWFNFYTNAITKVWHLEAVARLFNFDISRQVDLNAQLAQTGFSMQAYMEPENLRKS